MKRRLSLYGSFQELYVREPSVEQITEHGMPEDMERDMEAGIR